MESPFKPNNLDGVGSNMKSVGDINFRKQRFNYDIILRILGLLVTLMAAIMVGTDKHTKILNLTLIETLPPIHVPVTAKWHYMSALVYLLVSNAIASAYAAGSLIFYMVERNIKDNKSALMVTVLDIIIMTLLFSANGAVASVGLIGQYGNSHVQWNKVCNLVDGFCRQMAAAFTLSVVGSFMFLWLAVHAVIHLHRKSIS